MQSRRARHRGDFGPEHADTFRRDLHPDLRADYVLANPPFNDSDWFRKDNGASGKQCDMDEKPEESIRGNGLINDVRWQYVGSQPRLPDFHGCAVLKSRAEPHTLNLIR